MTNVGTVDRSRSGAIERAKAILFCPRCGHESPVDDDWILDVYDDRVDLHCPDCWGKVTTRHR